MSEQKIFPKIFGIGMSGTGSRSLIDALILIGYKGKHYPTCLEDFDNHEALGDIPVSSRFEFLDHMYPQSKFILTTRPIERWLANRTHKNAAEPRQSLWKYETRFNTYGRLNVDFDEDDLREAFETFHKRVRDYFQGRDNYLEMDITAGDGWEKLCPFLGRKIPTRDFPWRRTNYEDGSGKEVSLR